MENLKKQWRNKKDKVKISDTEDTKEFQSIVKLLSDFDEKTGRYKRYNDQVSHFARRAIAVAQPENVEFAIVVLPEGKFTYLVQAKIKTSDSTIETYWLHEDGIMAERAECKEDHPVQQIVCVTDIYQRALK